MAEQREQIEADYTYHRALELAVDPVRGNFDATHLKEVNRRIFQDLPGAGFNDVTPGEFRKTLQAGWDWQKQRGLTTVASPERDSACVDSVTQHASVANPIRECVCVTGQPNP